MRHTNINSLNPIKLVKEGVSDCHKHASIVRSIWDFMLEELKFVHSFREGNIYLIVQISWWMVWFVELQQPPRDASASSCGCYEGPFNEIVICYSCFVFLSITKKKVKNDAAVYLISIVYSSIRCLHLFHLAISIGKTQIPFCWEWDFCFVADVALWISVSFISTLSTCKVMHSWKLKKWGGLYMLLLAGAICMNQNIHLGFEWAYLVLKFKPDFLIGKVILAYIKNIIIGHSWFAIKKHTRSYSSDFILINVQKVIQFLTKIIINWILYIYFSIKLN